MVYIIIWSGGYELPQYAVSATHEEAMALKEEWINDMREGDIIDILALDLNTLELNLLVSTMKELYEH